MIVVNLDHDLYDSLSLLLHPPIPSASQSSGLQASREEVNTGVHTAHKGPLVAAGPPEWNHLVSARFCFFARVQDFCIKHWVVHLFVCV